MIQGGAEMVGARVAPYQMDGYQTVNLNVDVISVESNQVTPALGSTRSQSRAQASRTRG